MDYLANLAAGARRLSQRTSRNHTERMAPLHLCPLPNFFRRWAGCGLLLAALLAAGCGGKAPETLQPETQALLVAGDRALQMHDFETAFAYADSAEMQQSRVADPEFLRGRIYSEMMRYDEAEKAYRNALRIDPQYPGIWNNLGNNAVRQERYREGIALYRKELALRPSPVPWRGIGMTYVELGAADSARMAFGEALRLDSNYVSVYTDLAQLLQDDGAYDEALRYAMQALRRDPENLSAVYLVGNLYNLQGKNAEAIPYLARAVERWPWHNPSYYALGQALVRTGRQEEGKQLLEKAEQLRALDAKINQMEMTVRNVPSDAYGHAGMASLLRRAGRYNDAMHAYRVAVSLQPENLEFRNNIAALHLLRGDTLEAVRWYREALDLDPGRKDPTSTDILLNLGVVYAISGDMASARQAWQAVLEVKPGEPNASRYLASSAAEPARR